MRMVDLIHKKRDGGALTQDELRFVIQGYTTGDIPDYQMAAFAMAVFYSGMDRQETAYLTDAMMRSGDVLDLSQFGTSTVDKHSTGGVGDKTTMIVAPVVACLGGKVAKMTGRGLGHTGGTADKLESIPGFHINLTPEQFLKQVQELGIAVIAQSGDLTPADKKLYALRDVTATVDSLPLITSSIMSKKLAAGSHSIVLDVKIGSGAFMKTQQAGRELAQNMVDIGKACGRNVAAVMTNMDIPLGSCIGNSLEVMEAVEVLKGRGSQDLVCVSVELAANMLALSLGWCLDECYERVRACLCDGLAFSKMQQWVQAQGGDAEALEDFSRLPQAEFELDVLAPQTGYLAHMDAERIGEASVLLGAGRAKKEIPLTPAPESACITRPGSLLSAAAPFADFTPAGKTACSRRRRNFYPHSPFPIRPRSRSR